MLLVFVTMLLFGVLGGPPGSTDPAANFCPLSSHQAEESGRLFKFLALVGLYTLIKRAIVLLRALRRDGFMKGLLGAVTDILPSKVMDAAILAEAVPKIREKVGKIDLLIKDEGFRFEKIPEKAIAPKQVIEWLKRLEGCTADSFKKKKSLAGIYQFCHNEIQEANVEAFKIFAHSNGLYVDMFPPLRKFEAELLSMANAVLKGPTPHNGCMSRGGTESIFMAVLTYREQGHKNGITNPNIVIPNSAHVAFVKAAHYLKIEIRKTSGTLDHKELVSEMEKLIDANTVALVGSAPSWQGGMVDPIPEIAALALRKGVGMHVDNCLGGLYLCFLPPEERAKFPAFDFTVPGVTSISMDLHKFGGAIKGASTVLYKTPELRRCQYFSYVWSGGMMATPKLCGSHTGGFVAQAWANMLMMGLDGFKENARIMHNAFRKLRDHVEHHPHLELYGNPNVVAVGFTSKKFNIYKLVDAMQGREWDLSPNRDCVMLVVGRRQAEIIDDFIRDLDWGCEEVLKNPDKFKACAAVYGLVNVMVPSNAETFLGCYLDMVSGPRIEIEDDFVSG